MFKVGEKVYSKENKIYYKIIKVNKDTLDVTWKIFGKSYITTGIPKSLFIPNKKFVIYKGIKIIIKNKKYIWYDKNEPDNEYFSGTEKQVKEMIDMCCYDRKATLFRMGYKCQTCRYKKSNQNLRKKIKELKKEINRLEEQELELNERIDNMEWEQ